MPDAHVSRSFSRARSVFTDTRISEARRLFLLRGAEGGRTAEDSPCPWDMTARGLTIFLPGTVEDYFGAPFWQDAGIFRQSCGEFQAFRVFEKPTPPPV